MGQMSDITDRICNPTDRQVMQTTYRQLIAVGHADRDSVFGAFQNNRCDGVCGRLQMFGVLLIGLH
jgi:hypothetical protein